MAFVVVVLVIVNNYLHVDMPLLLLLDSLEVVVFPVSLWSVTSVSLSAAVKGSAAVPKSLTVNSNSVD